MKINRRGQLTIPRELRTRHGLLPGTEVRFVERGSALQLVRQDQYRLGAIERTYAEKAFPTSTDQLMKLLRGSGMSQLFGRDGDIFGSSDERPPPEAPLALAYGL